MITVKTWCGYGIMNNGNLEVYSIEVPSAMRLEDFERDINRRNNISVGPVYRATAYMAEREIRRLAGGKVASPVSQQ